MNDLKMLHQWKIKKQHKIRKLALSGFALYNMAYMLFILTAATDGYRNFDELTDPFLLFILFFPFCFFCFSVWRLKSNYDFPNWIKKPGRFFMLCFVSGYSGTILALSLLGPQRLQPEQVGRRKLEGWNVSELGIEYQGEFANSLAYFIWFSVILILLIGLWLLIKKTWSHCALYLAACASMGTVLVVFNWIPNILVFSLTGTSIDFSFFVFSCAIFAFLMGVTSLWLFSRNCIAPQNFEIVTPLTNVSPDTLRSYLSSARLIATSLLVISLIAIRVTYSHSSSTASISEIRQVYTATKAAEALKTIGFEHESILSELREQYISYGFEDVNTIVNSRDRSSYTSGWEKWETADRYYDFSNLNDSWVDIDWPNGLRASELRHLNDEKPEWNNVALIKINGSKNASVDAVWRTAEEDGFTENLYGLTRSNSSTLYGLKVTILDEKNEVLWEFRPLFRIEDRWVNINQEDNVPPINKLNSPESDFAMWVAWVNNNVNALEKIQSIAVLHNIQLSNPTDLDGSYFEVEQHIFNQSIAVPSLPGMELPPAIAGIVLISLCIVLMAVLRSRIRGLVRASVSEQHAPWLILDGHYGLEKLFAWIWTAGILLSPWIIGACTILLIRLSVSAGNVDDGAFESMLTAAMLIIPMLLGGWLSLTSISLIVGLRSEIKKSETRNSELAPV